MVKKLAFAIAAVIILIGMVILVPAVVEACQGGQCIDCMFFNCEWVPSPAHCNCEAGITETGGRYCVAGGNCYIIP